MNKHTRKILLIPVDYAFFWELLFIFYWLILMHMHAPREFTYNGSVDWTFIIFIAGFSATLTSPGLFLIEDRFGSWLDYRNTQISIGKREIHPSLLWIGKKLKLEERQRRYMKKHDHGDRWQESR